MPACGEPGREHTINHHCVRVKLGVRVIGPIYISGYNSAAWVEKAYTVGHSKLRIKLRAMYVIIRRATLWPRHQVSV